MKDNNNILKAPILIKDIGMQYPREGSKEKKRYGKYKCGCGEIFKTRMQSVIHGHIKSCGCLQKIILIKNNKKRRTHGDSNTRLYTMWGSMVRRCTDKSPQDYADRGISVCMEWITSYETFKIWAINSGYQENLSIDRINNDGNYEPCNCRFVTRNIQAQNTRVKRKNNTSGYKGVYFDNRSKKWWSRITVDKQIIHLGTYGNKTDAALAYNAYIDKHSLIHNKNNIGD